MGAWVAQLVEGLTLGFSTGSDLRVVGLSPVLGSGFKQGVCWRFSLSHVLSLSQTSESFFFF